MSYDDLRYNQIRQKSIHNAFQRHEGVFDQIVYWRVRSLEADIHTTHLLDPTAIGTEHDDWFVYHYEFDLFSSVHTLDGFLRTCAAAHAAIPGHEVITLFLDIKDGFPVRITDRHSRARLDALLAHHLGDSIYRPADLMARDPAARTAAEVVRGVGWPTLRELRGRFVVVLTGSDHQLGNYLSSRERPSDRLAFLSGNVGAVGDIGVDDDIVIYNMPAQRAGLAATVGDRGFVSRAYYVDDADAWEVASHARCNHVATDMVNTRRDPWADTSGPTGFPFAAHDGPTPREIEPGTIGAIWARSGDIWERADSCVFQHRALDAAAADGSYVFAVSGPNSHTEPWTKGGIMVRESTDPGSRYFGVFRVGQGSGPRVQFRSRPGAVTTVLDRHIGPSWRFGSHHLQDTLALLRLDIADGGRLCTGFGSIDGVDWELLGSFRFDVPLTLHGLAVSSHGQRRGAKYLFVVPGGGPPPDFDQVALIGPPDEPADGWVDWEETRRWRTTRFSR